MIVKRFTLFALAAFVIGVSVFNLWDQSEPTYFPRESVLNAPSSAKFYEEYMKVVRYNQETQTIDPRDIIKARSQADRMPNSKAPLNINWTFKGPDNVGGRTRAIVIDRNNPSHLIMGGVSGGLYESFDAATTWQPYDPDFEVTQITCITQDAAGDFYIGTGAHFETQGAPPGSSDDNARSSRFIGSGVYKLTGNGNYELIVGPNPNAPNLSFALNWATIGNIDADPNIPGKIYVAANHGFRAIENQNGNWVISSPINYDAKCLDVEVAPNGNALVTFKDNVGPPFDDARVYASTDGMQTWSQTSFSAAGRIEGAISESSPNVMYLGAARTNGCLFNVYRSSDSGQSWDIIGPGGASSFDPYANPLGCQGYWDNLIAVSPIDPGKIFVGGVTLYTWEQSTTDPAPPNGSWRRVDVTNPGVGFLDPRYVHADKHNMVFDPVNPKIAYVVSDGGITRSENIDDPQPFFLESNFNFASAQYYNIAVNPNDIVMGGTQDNGTHLVGLQYNSNRSGLEVLGGDGFGCEMSTINPEIGVASLYFNLFRRIQGIGTTLGNTNISQADIISNNSFFGGLCGPIGCQGPFYTVTELWESFNHEGSKDFVEVLIDRSGNGSLPPIPQDTVFSFEGNNNDFPLKDTLDAPAFPYDTLVTFIDTSRLTYNAGANNRLIVNYDTIVFDTTNKQIAVLRRGLADTLINYTDNGSYFVSNIITATVDTNINVDYEQIDTRIAVAGNSITVFYPRIIFRYKFNFVDKVQSIFASANWAGRTGTVDPSQRNVIITRDLLKNNPDIKWYSIAGPNSTPDAIDNFNDVLTMEFTPDGNYLFLGTRRGDVYRISDIDTIHSGNVAPTTGANLYSIQNGIMAGKCRKIGRFTGRSVTDISIDPNDPNKMVVALGNYGGTFHVARTTFALTANDPTSTFDFIQGSGQTELPVMPCYSVLIDKNNSNRVLLGTDMGIFATDNAFSVAPSEVDWYEENVGIGRVPVFDLDQMVFDFNRSINDGKIYAGTHARGIFETDQFTSVQDLSKEEEVKANLAEGLKIYPNPARDQAKIEFKMAERAGVRVQIYSLNGRLIHDEQYSDRSAGKNTIQLDLTDLSNGTYIVRAISGDEVSSSKMLIYK